MFVQCLSLLSPLSHYKTPSTFVDLVGKFLILKVFKMLVAVFKNILINNFQSSVSVKRSWDETLTRLPRRPRRHMFPKTINTN